MITVILHQTPIVEIDYDKSTVTFNNGGWVTVTTQTRMNQVCNEYRLPFRISRSYGDMAITNINTRETVQFNGETCVMPLA